MKIFCGLCLLGFAAAAHFFSPLRFWSGSIKCAALESGRSSSGCWRTWELIKSCWTCCRFPMTRWGGPDRQNKSTEAWFIQEEEFLSTNPTFSFCLCRTTWRCRRSSNTLTCFCRSSAWGTRRTRRCCTRTSTCSSTPGWRSASQRRLSRY